MVFCCNAKRAWRRRGRRPDELLRHPGLRLPRMSQALMRATAEYAAAFSRHDAPEVCLTRSPQEKKGAGKAGCAVHPQSRVQCWWHTGVVTTGPPEHPAFPAQWFTAYAVLSPATNSSCHRHRRIEDTTTPGWALRASADLTPATGVRTTRFCRPRLRRSSPRRLSANEIQRPALHCHARRRRPRPPHPTRRS
jgi:hypothetical protein